MSRIKLSSDEKFDVIIASDCMYTSEHATLLSKVLCKRLEPNGKFMMLNPMRDAVSPSQHSSLAILSTHPYAHLTLVFLAGPCLHVLTKAQFNAIKCWLVCKTFEKRVRCTAKVTSYW